MNLYQKLCQRPNLLAIADGNQECQELLSALGILDFLIKSDSPNLSVIANPLHPTHWIVAALWSGYATAPENGYRVIAIPKAGNTERDMHECMEVLLRDYNGHDRHDSTIELPDKWSLENTDFPQSDTPPNRK